MRRSGASTAGPTDSGGTKGTGGAQEPHEDSRNKFLATITTTVETLAGNPLPGPSSNARSEAHSEAVLDA